jgi:hypothetical protein
MVTLFRAHSQGYVLRVDPHALAGLHITVQDILTHPERLDGHDLRHRPDILVIQGVTWHWFYVDRPAPVLPYATAIAGYKRLKRQAPGPDKLSVERGLDELLTAAEVDALRDYLHRAHQTPIVAEAVALPLPWLDCQPSRQTGEGADEAGFRKLAEEPGYPLAFPVWGAVDRAAADDYCPGCYQTHEAGMAYVRKALALLGLPADVPPARLLRLVRTLQEDEGLVVTRR